MNRVEKLKQLKKFVRPLINDGKKTKELLEAVNSAGLTNVKGGNYTLDSLTHLLNYHGLLKPNNFLRVFKHRRKSRSAPVVKTVKIKTREHNDALALHSLILHSDLSDRVKVELLKKLEVQS